MSLLVLCSFTAIIALVTLIATKYHWTRVPVGSLLLYAAAGAVATVPSGLCNGFVNSETAFDIFSPDLIKSFVSFGIGAVGEEFFKMAGGLTVTLLLLGLHRDIGPAGRLLGFVTCGLSFAVVENYFVYASDDAWSMVVRGLLAVPLHGTMGMVHGVAVNRAIRRKGGVVVLFFGFFAAASVHCLYNNVATKIEAPYGNLILVVLILGLITWCLIRWHRVAEYQTIHPDPADEVASFAEDDDEPPPRLLPEP